ncbi:MAG TPA: NnrU family protein [Candidatus Binatia bacterium]|nr:NnrU family protein [Candidatus Binatia bacterium]
MAPAAEIALLWLAFAATHMGLSSVSVRRRLVTCIGERPFQGLYSLVALAIFVPLVSVFFANKHAGRWLWVFERGPALRWTMYVGMALAFVLLVASFVDPSPAGVVPGSGRVRGVYRLTRHPLLMAIALFATLHLLPNGSTADVAFFAGGLAFALVGGWHQDRRKLALGTPGFREFHAATPFLPFTGRETLRGVRELPPAVVAAGFLATVLVRWLHPRWFGGFVG